MWRGELSPQWTLLRGLKPQVQRQWVGISCCQHLMVGQGLGSHTGCSQTVNNLQQELDLGWFLERKYLSGLVAVFGFSSNVSSQTVDIFQHALINCFPSPEDWNARMYNFPSTLKNVISYCHQCQ